MSKKGDIMFKQVIIGLLVTSAIALLWTDANAGCVNIGGTRLCADWITGSEICVDSVTGLGNIKNCTPGVNCPVVTCSAFGTIPLGSNSCTNNFDPNRTDCGISGIAFCVNKPGNSSNANGNPFILDAVLTGIADITTCDKNGRCRTSIELEPGNCPDCCINPNWHLLTFTAGEFNAEAKVCPGGYDTEGKCCSSTDRNGGLCISTTTETIYRQLCTVDLTGIKPDVQRAYTCVPVS